MADLDYESATRDHGDDAGDRIGCAKTGVGEAANADVNAACKSSLTSAGPQVAWHNGSWLLHTTQPHMQQPCHLQLSLALICALQLSSAGKLMPGCRASEGLRGL